MTRQRVTSEKESLQARDLGSNSQAKTRKTWLQNTLGHGNAFQTRGGYTKDRGVRGFTAALRRAKTLVLTGKTRQIYKKRNNRKCNGVGEVTS